MLIHHFLEESYRRFPEKCALVYGKARLSYKNIYRKACAFSHFLIDRKIRKGDRIIIVLENSPEYVIAYYGILMAGGVVVSLSTQLKSDSIAPLLDELEPSSAIVSHQQFQTLSKCDKHIERIGSIII